MFHPFRKVFEKMIDELIEKETLDSDQIKSIFLKCK
jgi:ATP-dependent Zn protease